MHATNRKYIHLTDEFGELLAYVDDYSGGSEDMLFVHVIAERNKPEEPWYTENRDAEITVVLNSKKKWKFYDSHEEFAMEFFDAII